MTNVETGPDQLSKTRRVYGRGYMDGFRAANKAREEVMTPSKHESALRGMTVAAKRVLEFVSSTEECSATKVASDMMNAGHKSELSAVMGCLSSLERSGLVREVHKGSFIRVEPRQRPTIVAVETTRVPAPTPDPAAAAQQQPPATTDTMLDRIASLGKRMRELSNIAEKVASEIDSIGIEIEERFASSEAKSEKLRQLHDLLRSIGTAV